jgi:hypothetical protein
MYEGFVWMWTLYFMQYIDPEQKIVWQGYKKDSSNVSSILRDFSLWVCPPYLTCARFRACCLRCRESLAPQPQPSLSADYWRSWPAPPHSSDLLHTHTHTQRNVLLFKIIKQEKNRPGQRGKITYIWIQTKNRWGNRESRLRMDLFTDVVHICVIECAHMVAFPTWLRHGVSHVSRCRSVTGPWRAAGGSCRRVLRTRLHWIDILFYFIQVVEVTLLNVV